MTHALTGPAAAQVRRRGNDRPSVLRADAGGVVYLALVPEPGNPFHRARHCEVGLTEWLTGACSGSWRS